MEKSVEDRQPEVLGPERADFQQELDRHIENCAILKTRCVKLQASLTETEHSLTVSKLQCEEKGTQKLTIVMHSFKKLRQKN